MSAIDDFVNGKNGQAESCAMDAGIPLPNELGLFPVTRDAVFRIRYHEYTTGAIAAENLAQLIEKEIDAAEEEIRELRKCTEWIPVSERYPEICEPVLVCRPSFSGNKICDICWYDAGTWWVDAHIALDRKYDIVTHWMPLMLPPQGVKR